MPEFLVSLDDDDIDSNNTHKVASHAPSSPVEDGDFTPVVLPTTDVATYDDATITNADSPDDNIDFPTISNKLSRAIKPLIWM